MLSQLRENNRNLKSRLRSLKKESNKVYHDVSRNPDDAILGASNRPVSSISRCRSIGDIRASAIQPSSGRSLLSDHAKCIRGEASKRIENLLMDWKDYKKRAEEEIRQRFRVEQSLRECLTRKDKQVEKLSDELHSMKLISEEQRQMIDQLNDELEAETKCRIKCSDLEDELKNVGRCVENLSSEIRIRDEIIHTTEQERDVLNCNNVALQEKNLKLKSRIQECEQDVNATRAELEILDDMVHTMHSRKQTIVTSSRPGSAKSMSPSSSVTDFYRASKKPAIYSTPKKSKKLGSPNPYGRRGNVTMGTPRKTSVTCCAQSGNETEWSLGNKKSALTALRSLQREHATKCNFLAENIKKLKDESRDKERKITNLQKSMRSNRSFY